LRRRSYARRAPCRANRSGGNRPSPLTRSRFFPRDPAEDDADWESDSFCRMGRANSRFSRTMLGCQARGMIFPLSTI
jgi:hypothetical protein